MASSHGNFRDFCFGPGDRPKELQVAFRSSQEDEDSDVQELSVEIVINDGNDSDSDIEEPLSVEDIVDIPQEPVVRTPVVDGPLWCKLLVPTYFAGGMIGKGGKNMAEFEKLTQCNVRISAVNVCFPGTHDRMLAIGASTMSSLETCIEMLLKQMRQINVRLRGQRFVVKMLIPNSAASKIIGRDGCHAREMAAQTGCRTSISRRNPGIQERVVLLVGEEHGLATGTKLVARKIQDDPHLAEHMHFSYDVELPLGSWDCCKTGPMEPRAELLSPEVARTLPKRNLVEYLHKAAPREILVRYRLLGSMRKILKMKTHEQVMEVVEQTWQTRRPGEGQMATVPASPAERSVDPAGMLPFYPVGLLPLQGGLSEISESKGEKKEADDSSQTTDTPSRYRSDNQDEDIKYPGLENDSQGVIDCARSLLDRAKDQAKTSKKMDCEEAKTAMGYVAATMMQLLKVVDAEKSDAEKLLEQLNIRYFDAAQYAGTDSS